jgi:hypothetical protein
MLQCACRARIACSHRIWFLAAKLDISEDARESTVVAASTEESFTPKVTRTFVDRIEVFCSEGAIVDTDTAIGGEDVSLEGAVSSDKSSFATS